MPPGAPDARLSNYRLDRLLGSGGMGAVYLAHDLALDRDVAIKFLSDEKIGDLSARHRLLREAKAAAALDHPNICAVHEVIVEPDGRAAIVMQYCEGETLGDVVRRGPLDPRFAISIAADVTSALAAAHKRGIIHRDIKPQNIIITPDRRAKLLDFGIARHLEITATTDGAETTTLLTTPGVIVGTPSYMSPEQAQQQALDGRSDLFSLGAVLYEALTGKRPFSGRSSIDVLGAVLHQQPPDVSTVRPEITAQYDELVRRLLAKHPDDRFKSADELLGALRLLVPDTSRTNRPSEVPLERPAPLSRRRRYVIAGIAAAAIAVAGAATWLFSPTAEAFTGAILVANFGDNAGDPGLAETVREALTVKLQQSRALNVLSREQVMGALQRMERAASKSLDQPTAIELCQREGIPLLLAGSLDNRGGAIWVTVTGIDPVSRAARFSVTSEFQSDRDVFRGMDVLARRVRRQLGESVIGIAKSNASLAEVTTPSVEALRLYTQGREHHVRGDADAAMPLIAQALQIDPKFAMAHRLMGRLYQTRGNTVKAREHLSRAYEFKSNLTQKERFQVEASYFRSRGEYERAVQTLVAATSVFPADGDARYDLALAYRDNGQLAPAIEQLELTVKNTPLVTDAYGELVLLLARAGEYPRARATYDAARARNVAGPKLDWGYAMMLLGEGRTADARKQLETVRTTSSVYAGTARLYMATADILDGKLRAASEQLEADVLLDSKDENDVAEFIRRHLLARTLLVQGREEAAKKQLAALLAILEHQPAGAWWHERLVAGALLVKLNDAARAKMLLKQMEQGRSGGFAHNCYHTLAGEIALAEGKPADAVRELLAAAAQYPRVITTEALARAYSAQRDWQRAVPEWRKVIDAKGEALREHFAAEWVVAHLEAGRASRAAADLATAQRYYDGFLELWKNNDGLDIVRIAGNERRALPPRN
jgi:tetratricopeptide (TPR) repeat protein/predicted Ser/Thr protein kinase